ncbi:MAG TPA: flagellar FliJ family protein [Chloroflexota bacterium]|nr:flagellar FliJ family protein [Chloroflexota bacterium]
MQHNPDTALEVALEQRQRLLDQERQSLSEHLRAVQEQLELFNTAQARVRMVVRQIDAAQRPAPGVALPVTLLGDLERVLDWCEVQVAIHEQRLEVVQAEAEDARGLVATAHQAVRALEVVLEARVVEREEKVRRAELRMADETAARVHSRNLVLR